METFTTDFLGDLRKVQNEKRDILFAALYTTLLSLLITDTERGRTYNCLYGILQGLNKTLKEEIKKSYPQGEKHEK